MILTGLEITNEVKRGRIVIDSFDPKCVTTNSYDLSLGDTLLEYSDKVLDPRKKPKVKKIIIPDKGKLLKKGSFTLGSTREIIGSEHFVPIIHARSGIARLGLFVHITADLIDIGSIGNSTLQLFATLPIKVYSGMKIAQVSFWVPKGKIVLYEGKYQNSNGPQPSMTYKDYK